MKPQQRLEDFFKSGTMGAKDGKRTLEAVVARMNSEGWKVDQVVPLLFGPNFTKDGHEVVKGVVLCTKFE